MTATWQRPFAFRNSPMARVAKRNRRDDIKIANRHAMAETYKTSYLADAICELMTEARFAVAVVGQGSSIVRDSLILIPTELPLNKTIAATNIAMN